MQPQGVTHVVEAQGVGQLGVEQADDLTPRAEGAGVVFDASVARQFGHQMWRNEVAKLTENGEFSGVGLDGVFLMPYLVARRNRSSQHFFIPQPSIVYDGNVFFYKK